MVSYSIKQVARWPGWEGGDGSQSESCLKTPPSSSLKPYDMLSKEEKTRPQNSWRVGTFSYTHPYNQPEALSPQVDMKPGVFVFGDTFIHFTLIVSHRKWADTCTGSKAATGCRNTTPYRKLTWQLKSLQTVTTVGRRGGASEFSVLQTPNLLSVLVVLTCWKFISMEPLSSASSFLKSPEEEDIKHQTLCEAELLSLAC